LSFVGAAFTPTLAEAAEPATLPAMSSGKPDACLVLGHRIVFGTPRRLPKVATLEGRVAVLDIAFAGQSGGRKNSFEKTTLKFINALGDTLVAWVDHHDSIHHQQFADDPRFVLATKAQHGACPEMVTPELVARLGPVDTVVCHTDFDGLASAAKWVRGGEEPYAGCDDDARAIDTRIGFPGEIGTRFDRALRGRPRDNDLMRHIVQQLAAGISDDTDWAPIAEAEQVLLPLEHEARRLAQGYVARGPDLVTVDVVQQQAARYDKTLLLLLGQQQAKMAAVLDGDTVTFAAPFDSGVNFLERFELSGGMPTLVSIHRAKLAYALAALDVENWLAEPSP